MARIRLCDCGAPPAQGRWCRECAHERERQHEPLGLIQWGTGEVD